MDYILPKFGKHIALVDTDYPRLFRVTWPYKDDIIIVCQITLQAKSPSEVNRIW